MQAKKPMKPLFRVEKIIQVRRENLRLCFFGVSSDGNQWPRMYCSASVRKSKISLALVRGLLKGVLHLKHLLFKMSNILSNIQQNFIVGWSCISEVLDLETSLQNSKASATDLLVENVVTKIT